VLIIIPSILCADKKADEATAKSRQIFFIHLYYFINKTTVIGKILQHDGRYFFKCLILSEINFCIEVIYSN